MASWLLRLHDHIEDDELLVTQDAMAELLGVRRPTVTQVAAKLKEAGAIRSSHRSFIEIDRGRLEASTCPCYQAMSSPIERTVHPIKPSPVQGNGHLTKPGF
jgi:DNA-binding transcriptional regulator YhcF (GntR family)